MKCFSILSQSTGYEPLSSHVLGHVQQHPVLVFDHELWVAIPALGQVVSVLLSNQVLQLLALCLVHLGIQILGNEVEEN